MVISFFNGRPDSPASPVSWVLAHRRTSAVASGIRRKWAGAGSGFVMMLGDGCDSLGLITGLGRGGASRA
jgi:hypothetical protein